MFRRCAFVALLIVAVLIVGLRPSDRESVAAIQHGDQLTAARDYGAALHAYQSAAARHPGSPVPYLRQGMIYVAQGRYEEAWGAYLAALRVGGLTDATREALANLHVARHSEQLAIGYLESLLARHPGRSDLWLALGDAHLAIGHEEEARRAFSSALAVVIEAERSQALHVRMGMLDVESDPGRARDHLEEAAGGPNVDLARDAARLGTALSGVLDPDVDPAFARAKLGEALFHHGDLALARRQLEMAVALEPTYVDGHAYLGHVLSVLGERDLAVEHLARAIDLEPTYTLAYYFLGMHCVRSGSHVTGRDHLFRAYDLDPTNPAICAAVADTYLRDADPEYAAAERWLHAAVDNAPDDVRFHLLLAHFYVDYMIDPAVRGLAVAQVAVSLAPGSAEARETLGWAYHLSGQSLLALPELQRAQERVPDEPRVYYRLGEVYRALGRLEDARQSYRQAVDLDWGGSVGSRARQAMASVGGSSD